MWNNVKKTLQQVKIRIRARRNPLLYIRIQKGKGVKHQWKYVFVIQIPVDETFENSIEKNNKLALNLKLSQPFICCCISLWYFHMSEIGLNKLFMSNKNTDQNENFCSSNENNASINLRDSFEINAQTDQIARLKQENNELREIVETLQVRD